MKNKLLHYAENALLIFLLGFWELFLLISVKRSSKECPDTVRNRKS